jgi:hypothetical protein
VNGELRARAVYKELPNGSYGEGPHVVWQLRRYQRWVDRPVRLTQVRDAYVKAARLLLGLAELSGKRGPAINAWHELVDAGDKAVVVLPPGIVVAGYCPSRADGIQRAESGVYAAKIESFGQHSARLRRHGATVLTVNAKPEGSVLPNLIPGAISAVEHEVS